MSNEVLFILMSVVTLSFVLISFRLGKSWLIALIAVNAVLMNIFIIKGMYLFGLGVTGGNVLYASIFLGTDILSEHYGKKNRPTSGHDRLFRFSFLFNLHLIDFKIHSG